jgi:hypothetical protein
VASANNVDGHGHEGLGEKEEREKMENTTSTTTRGERDWDILPKPVHSSDPCMFTIRREPSYFEERHRGVTFLTETVDPNTRKHQKQVA